MYAHQNQLKCILNALKAYNKIYCVNNQYLTISITLCIIVIRVIHLSVNSLAAKSVDRHDIRVKNGETGAATLEIGVMCVCVCVCERERERQRETEREKGRAREREGGGVRGGGKNHSASARQSCRHSSIRRKLG